MSNTNNGEEGGKEPRHGGRRRRREGTPSKRQKEAHEKAKRPNKKSELTTTKGQSTKKEGNPEIEGPEEARATSGRGKRRGAGQSARAPGARQPRERERAAARRNAKEHQTPRKPGIPAEREEEERKHTRNTRNGSCSLLGKLV